MRIRSAALSEMHAAGEFNMYDIRAGGARGISRFFGFTHRLGRRSYAQRNNGGIIAFAPWLLIYDDEFHR